MITAWQVYWVMQLDSIGATLTFFTIAATIAAGVYLLIGAQITGRGCYPSEEDDAAWARIKKLSTRLVIFAAVLGFVSALIPSTNTAAAMIVLPAITSPGVVEPLKGEAHDLYELAKQAIGNLAKEHKPEPTK